MKATLTVIILIIAAFNASAQTQQRISAQPDSSKEIMLVEASCGQCQFGMKGQGCTLAVRIEGKAYFVEGTGIDEYGDAHAHDGFCEAIRTAKVQGEIVDDKFKASYFELVREPVK